MAAAPARVQSGSATLAPAALVPLQRSSSASDRVGVGSAGRSLPPLAPDESAACATELLAHTLNPCYSTASSASSLLAPDDCAACASVMTSLEEHSHKLSHSMHTLVALCMHGNGIDKELRTISAQ